MKNQEFQFKLLIKQNTQLAVKLQSYRRQNIQLIKKNQSLNSWVQNLSQVLASISSTWKTITQNEQALYILMLKKQDPASKQIMSKYINHFKTYGEIVDNLAQKITDDTESNQVTFDTKNRLSLFVSNYSLFFTELVETYFKFNQDHMQIIQEKLKQQKIAPNVKQLMQKDFENKQKIKQFQEFFTKINQNMKKYENIYEYQIINGLIKRKQNQIQQMKEKCSKMSRRLAYMTDYNVNNIQFVLKDENLQCSCGGAQLQYYCKKLEQNNSIKQSQLQKKLSQVMVDEREQQGKEKNQYITKIQNKYKLLLQRNIQLSDKLQKMKIQNKIAEQRILSSPVYLHLRNQFKQLIEYTNDLLKRLNKNYQHINQIQKLRLQQIQDIKKKYQNKDSSHISNQEKKNNNNYQFFDKLKQSFQQNFAIIKQIHTKIGIQSAQKQQNIRIVKENLKNIKKDNDELNKKLNQILEKQNKNIQNMEFRYPKYTQLEVNINNILKLQNPSQQILNIRKTWQQFVEYAKNRDKKIRVLEDIIKKRDKQIANKIKSQQVFKNMLNETQNLFTEIRQKFDKFPQFIDKVEKQLISLSEQIYKYKLQFEQQKSILSIRLKNEIQAKNKLDEKVKLMDKIQVQMKNVKQQQQNYEIRIGQYMLKQKAQLNELKMQLKQKNRYIQNILAQLNQKNKIIKKNIQNKQKNYTQTSKKSINVSQDLLQNLQLQMQNYKNKIMCMCGNDRQKSVLLKTCSHFFCKQCIDNAECNRSRRCPICTTKFGRTDTLQPVWT